MRLGLISQSVAGGGAQQVARSWAAALAQAGHVVTLVSLDDQAEHEMLPGVVPSSALPTRPRSHGRRVLYLRSLLRAHDFDVVLSLQTYPNLLTLAASRLAGRSTKIVISEHTVPSIFLAEKLSYRIQMALARRFYRRADRTIAVSHAVAADLMINYGITPEKCVVIPNGVIESLGRPAPEHHHAVEPGEPAEPIRILVPARVSTAKRPQLAAAICDAVANRGSSVELFWVGDRSPDASGFQFDHREGVVLHWLPWRPDWVRLATRRSVVLLPSIVEGFGNVLVEASAAGIPTVAGSTALGVADAIVPGISGVLAMTDTPESYADAILRSVELHPDPHVLADWLAEFTVLMSGERLGAVLESLANE